MTQFDKLPESIKERLESLANSMGVSKHDALCLANGVISEMNKDEVLVNFNDSDDKQRTCFVEAYVPHAVRTFDKFHTALLTRSDLKKEFIAGVINEAK